MQLLCELKSLLYEIFNGASHNLQEILRDLSQSHLVHIYVNLLKGILVIVGVIYM